MDEERANFLPNLDVRALYDHFDAPVCNLDCGLKCAPHNPDGSGKPVCCDICQAVPVAYQQEWRYLQPHTNLWHLWRGDPWARRTEWQHERHHSEHQDRGLCRRQLRARSGL